MSRWVVVSAVIVTALACDPLGRDRDPIAVAAAEPAGTDPPRATLEPARVEPARVEPVRVEPVRVEPVRTEPVHTPARPASVSTPKLRSTALVAHEPPIVLASSMTPSVSPGLVAIDGAFDGFRELLRATPQVSGGKRTAYRERKSAGGVATAELPAWTRFAGRRDLSAPSWWTPADGHTYLVVPFVLAGRDAQFDSAIQIHGYAIYTVDGTQARFVHGVELDQRKMSCGGGREIWAIFASTDGTTIREVQTCAETPAGYEDACVVRVHEGGLQRACAGMMGLVGIGPRR